MGWLILLSSDFTVVINGASFNCLTDLNIEFNKLWSENTGRTYKDGAFAGTLVGIFPKLAIEFAPRTANELSSLITECNKARQVIQWYNPQFKNKVTTQFYANDFSVSLTKALSGDYDRLTVNFISTNRQG